ncbi:bifunctional adenosylcobinamide kinase/adenosylcobinamide-phosphate guanylyltransferase [Paenibacillus aceris]|uniref:Adenosylcobinamide kinase n=1 Tax=Paenibacillus aceris TaxID=869555 RepID=A0ABS4HWV6_9BACL|nr:bifunctional adenosylcobinamide kinase/adenosylcobinamide-phosphate guanylyltransferase [Paenibacillus aceris]MBP1962424.1 adenosylcobinamide kinase/adenosylcobinamide-phosphate guanylyltransferase [Paenibacillus aceris]NHW37239.1 bifunctional adenosylcobinamide kinase/adenosylcobinamide-phosphate guanylyltransferase [Paenibacillus aceris]
MAVLVTGGARSGKSSFAEKLAMHGSERGVYIATSHIYDEEMRERVDLHQQMRLSSGYPWDTREEPFRLCELLKQLDESGEEAVVLVDCLTLWLSNWLLQYEGDDKASALVMKRIEELVEGVSGYSGRLILVTNEVGDGIVPEYPLGRSFRDLAGRMNQRLAEVCEQVFLVTVGIPIELKSRAYRFDLDEGK